MKRTCITCRRVISTGSYCPAHTKHRGSTPRPINSSTQARWRKQVLATTAGRCAIQDCITPYHAVEAHHATPLHAGGDPLGRGIPLCRYHHHAAHRTAVS